MANKRKPTPIIIDVDADEHNANWIRILDRQREQAQPKAPAAPQPKRPKRPKRAPR